MVIFLLFILAWLFAGAVTMFAGGIIFGSNFSDDNGISIYFIVWPLVWIFIFLNFLFKFRNVPRFIATLGQRFGDALGIKR